MSACASLKTHTGSESSMGIEFINQELQKIQSSVKTVLEAISRLNASEAEAKIASVKAITAITDYAANTFYDEPNYHGA